MRIMEAAAARLLQRSLDPGESSVGLAMKLERFADGAGDESTLRIVAAPLARRGRVHAFHIDAFDDDGLVASAEHLRAVVLPRRVMALARKRAGLPSMLLAL